MRKRIGNPSGEVHGKPMRVYDWYAPAGIDPVALINAIEARVPGLKLYHRGDGEVHGFVNTSLRPDGTLYVSVHLYDSECVSCGQHPGIVYRRMVLDPGDEAKLAHPSHVHPTKNIRGDNNDVRIFLDDGFGPGDSALQND